MSAIKVQITNGGGLQMLQNDNLDLREFGQVSVFRASHVEFSDDKQKWYVQSARTLEILRDDFESRADAITWEKQYYAPDGDGWWEIEDRDGD